MEIFLYTQCIFKTGTWAELQEAPIGSRKKYEKKHIHTTNDNF